MLKKLDHPILWVILCSCFFAGFGFAVGEAVQRVNDASAVSAVPKNILESAGEYFDRRVILFTIVFLIAAAVDAGFLVYRLRLKRQVTRATKSCPCCSRGG